MFSKCISSFLLGFLTVTFASHLAVKTVEFVMLTTGIFNDSTWKAGISDPKTSQVMRDMREVPMNRKIIITNKRRAKV